MADPALLPTDYEWLKDVFTDEEIASLEAFYQHETGLFQCIGFVGETGMISQFAEPAKAQAIARLEKEYREDLKEYEINKRSK